MTLKIKDILVSWVTSFLSINLFGVIRSVFGWPLELLLGVSVGKLLGFRIFSLIPDALLGLLFILAREGLYSLGLIDKKKRKQVFVWDTSSFTVYKSISYVFSLQIFTSLSSRNFWTLVGINSLLFLVTGAINCWHIDITKKQWPDLARRILEKRLRIGRRKKKA